MADSETKVEQPEIKIEPYDCTPAAEEWLRWLADEKGHLSMLDVNAQRHKRCGVSSVCIGTAGILAMAAARSTKSQTAVVIPETASAEESFVLAIESKKSDDFPNLAATVATTLKEICVTASVTIVTAESATTTPASVLLFEYCAANSLVCDRLRFEPQIADDSGAPCFCTPESTAWLAGFRGVPTKNLWTDEPCSASDEDIGTLLVPTAVTAKQLRTISVRFALRFLHFNDVYNVFPNNAADGCGGAARFTRLLNSYRGGGERFDVSEPLTIFSGDAFSPSIETNVTHGEHMIAPLNSFGIAAAVYGNHDFDLGTAVLEELAGKCNFPWLLSNVKAKATGLPLANGVESCVVSHCGVRIGFIGLVEQEWLATLTCIDADSIDFEPAAVCAERLALELKANGAEIVFALTHMRFANDIALAKELVKTGNVEIILGGHDHDHAVFYGEAPECEAVAPADGAVPPGCETAPPPPEEPSTYEPPMEKMAELHGPEVPVMVIKSGADFKDLSVIDIDLQRRDGKPMRVLTVAHEHVRTTPDMPEDEALAAELENLKDAVQKHGDKVLGRLGVPLNCKFAELRTKETNAANWVADAVRHNIRPTPDVCLFNSGTLRTDAEVPAGNFTVADLNRMLPMLDALVVIRITGKQLLAALENGVSQWPKAEGRFPCVSGVMFAFDGRKPSGQRVIAGSVDVNGEPLELERSYTLVTKEYLQSGKDGYDVFTECPVVQDAEECKPLPTALVYDFIVMDAIYRFRSAGAASRDGATVRKAVARLMRGTSAAPSENGDANDAAKQCSFRPEVEGRIREGGADTASSKLQPAAQETPLRSPQPNPAATVETTPAAAPNAVAVAATPAGRSASPGKALSPEQRRDRLQMMAIRPTTDVNELREYFDAIDVSGDGTLDRKEFLDVYSRLDDFGVETSPEKKAAMFKKFDRSKDGRINFDEFCYIMIARANRM